MPMCEVTLEEFESIDFEKPIHYTKTLDCVDMGVQYGKAAEESRAGGRPTEEKVYRLFETALSKVYLSPKTPPFQDPFKDCGHPDTLKEKMAKLTGKQATVFPAILPSVQNPSLKARLAEIVLADDNQKKGMAKIAISSYCESVDWSLNGTASFSIGDKLDENYMICETLYRACTLSDFIGWEGVEVVGVKNLIIEMYLDAYDRCDMFKFNDVARLALDFSIVYADKVFKDAEFLLGHFKDYLKDEMTQLCEDAKSKSDAKKKERD